MAQLLLNANATVTIGHSKSPALPELARQADILVAAVGRAEMVKVNWLKPGATVIDVGINRVAAPEKAKASPSWWATSPLRSASRSPKPSPGSRRCRTNDDCHVMANTVIAAHRRAGVAAPSF